MTIRQESSFLLQLTERVKAGRAVPAAFQRPYVWSEKDIVALWTSIIKGYPLGAFLFWQPPGKDISEYAQAALGPIRIPELQRPALILDGQNRLVTFAWSMTPDRKSTSELQSLMRISYAVFCLTKKNKQ